jgi:pyridinium-3,5-biscarboxylic acid mononucleotide sulfurtransferase
VITTAEMDNPAFTANPPNRCYHCKSELFGTLRRMAHEAGLACVVDGSNVNDKGDFRPGTRAAGEHGVKRPLQELGFTKLDIRAASRAMGLPTADKPAAACLASRFPYGTTITERGLSLVDRAEEALQKLGFRQCRVRLHGDAGRIELAPAELANAVRRRAVIVRRLREAGLRYVALDLEGYRTGSMNEMLRRSTAESQA